MHSFPNFHSTSKVPRNQSFWKNRLSYLTLHQIYDRVLNISIKYKKKYFNMVYRFCVINHKSLHDRGMLERNQILERRRLGKIIEFLEKYFALFLHFQGHRIRSIHREARFIYLCYKRYCWTGTKFLNRLHYNRVKQKG